MWKYKDVEDYVAYGFLASYLAFLLSSGNGPAQVPGAKKVQYDSEPHITLSIESSPCPPYIVDIYRSGKALFYEPKNSKPCMSILPDGSFDVKRDSSCIKCRKNPGETEV